MSTQYLTHRITGLEATPLAEYSMMNIQQSAGYPNYPVPGRSIQQNSGSLSLPNPISTTNGSPVSPRPNYDHRHGPSLADDHQIRNGVRPSSPPQSPRTGHQWSSANSSTLPPPFHPPEPQASSSRRPPAPQEPKVSGDPYTMTMTTSPRFGPTSQNYPGGYQRGQHESNWGYGSRVPPVSSPLANSYSHGAEYGDHSPSLPPSSGTAFNRTPAYAPSASTPTSAQFSRPRAHQDSHSYQQNTQGKDGGQYSSSSSTNHHPNYSNYDSSERYHLPAPSFESPSHGQHSYTHSNSRGSDMAPHTPSSGTISPHVSHGETPRLDALANASLKDQQIANSMATRNTQGFQPPPPSMQQGYHRPGSQRTSSFSNSQMGPQNGSRPYEEERVVKRPRIDTGPVGRSLSLNGPESAERRPAPSHESMSASTPLKTKPFFEDHENRDSRSPSEQRGSHSSVVNGIPFNEEWGWTKGGKPRQRLPLACLSCRHKKIRCKPSTVQGEKCTHCTKMNLECTYGKKESKSRSKDQTPKISRKASSSSKIGSASAEPSVSSVASPSRMVKTEPDIRDADHNMNGTASGQADYAPSSSNGSLDMKSDLIIPKTEAVESMGMDMDTPKFSLEGATNSTGSEYADTHMSGQVPGYSIPAIPVPEQPNTPHMADRTPISSFVHPAPMSSISSPTSTLYGEVTSSRRAFSSKSSVRSAATPRAELPKTYSPLNKDPRHEFLPDKDTLRKLVELYFTHVYSQTYAFLHRASFLEQLYDDTPYKPTLLLALCAVAARFDREQKQHEELYAQAARREILNHFDVNKLEVVQAMLIMGLHDFGSANGDKAWMFCGMAIRMGAALNLNLPSKTSKGFIEAEVERRTYWSYYLMDRFNGYGVARPFLTQDDDCQIQLPCDQVSFDKGIQRHTLFLDRPNPHQPSAGTDFMGAMAFLVRITAIWGKILKTIHFHRDLQLRDDPRGAKRHAYDQLRRECLLWDESLPPGLRYSSENIDPQIGFGTVGSFVMMHVIFHASMIYLYRYLSTVGVPAEDVMKEDDGDMLVRGIRGAFLHGDAVLQIVEHVRQKKNEAANDKKEVIVIAPFLGHIIKESCEISLKRLSFIPNLNSAQAEKQRRRVLCGLVWVRELKKYWKPLESMAQTLERLCRPLHKYRKKSSNSPATSKHSPSDHLYGFSTTPEMITSSMTLMPPTTAPVDNHYYQEPIGQQFWDYPVPEAVFEEAFSEQALMSTAQEEFNYYTNNEYEVPFDIDFAYIPMFPGPMDPMTDLTMMQPMVGIPTGQELPQSAPTYVDPPMEEQESAERDERCSVDRELDEDDGTQSETDTVEGTETEPQEKDAHIYFDLSRAVVSNQDSATGMQSDDRGPSDAGSPTVQKRGSEGMPLKFLLNDVFDYIGPANASYARKGKVEASIVANAKEEKTVTNGENITKHA
ncbi:hypothetical protein BJ508DRAFT_321148 [Ascobolus immersus RN42]|uniref:Zn(2)-C6 fungal-type domain-containing protein n=1 Tax=Ascobolus immersus RN42 TaxID=1160509 RepID=A0A3N4ISV4_ASCIM|nr:hypothetical protein BJ508DRAFT_321148 [Ascobolus immersus RN42]